MREQLADSVLDAGVINHHEYSSNHEPVYCVLSSTILSSTSSQEAALRSRPSWKKATIEEKQLIEMTLNLKLEAIMIPTQLLESEDIHCKNEEHLEAVDWFATEVMEAIHLAGEETLPFPGAGMEERKKKTPGFKACVQPFKEHPLFWQQVWKSAGCPLNTELHKVMKRTRSKYHQEYKECVQA